MDSDNRVDYDAYMKILAKLRELACGEPALDMFIANYVYDKAGVRHKKIIRMPGFPKNRLFAWNDVKFILKGHYMLMHSIIYRTELLRGCGLELPKHTFYVDNTMPTHRFRRFAQCTIWTWISSDISSGGKTSR